MPFSGIPSEDRLFGVFKNHQLLFLFCYLSVGSCCPFPSYVLLLDVHRFSLNESARSHMGSRVRKANSGDASDWRYYSEGLKGFSKHDLILCQSVYNTVLGVSQNEACFKFMQFKKMLGNGVNGALCSLHVSLM